MNGSTNLTHTHSPVTSCDVPDVNLFGTVNVTWNSASPYWSPISGALSYDVQYRIRNLSPAAAWSATLNTTNPSITLIGLQASNDYEFRVQAKCSGGDSGYPQSPPTSGWFTTISIPPCYVPTILPTTSINGSGATLNWASVSGAITYAVAYRKFGTSTFTAVSSTPTSKTITGLLPSTQYEFKIRAGCANAVSAFSSLSTFTTMVACNVTPSWFGSAITDISATLNWTAVSGALGYNFRYRVWGASLWTITSSPTNAIPLTGLSASTQYQFQIQTSCAGQASNFTSYGYFTTLPPACPVPVNLYSPTVTDTTATFNWDAVSAATSYAAQYREQGSTTWLPVTSAANSQTITGLTPERKYEFQTKAVCGSNSSAFTATSVIKTLVPFCNATTSLSVSGITNYSATLNWAPVGGAVGYYIEYRKVGDPYWSWDTTTANNLLLAGLQSSTNYEFQVQTTCASNFSLFTVGGSFTTVAPACGTPNVNTFGTSNVDANSASANWSAVSGAIYYNVAYRIRNIGAAYSEPVRTNSNFISLTGLLQPSTDYEFTVQAVCSGGGGTPSFSGWLTTAPAISNCNAPTGTFVSSITNTTAVLNWNPEPAATSYIAQYRKVGNNVWTRLDSSSLNKSVYGLLASNNYEFQIQSICPGGASGYSPAVSFTTNASCSNVNSNGSHVTPRNMWVWRDPAVASSREVVNDFNERTTFFTFAEQQNVKTIYINSRYMLDKFNTVDAENGGTTPNNIVKINTENNLPDFISIAASKCMDVQLLIGDDGAYVSAAQGAVGYTSMAGIVNRAVQYVNGITGTKPTAIHWDLEPQQQPDFLTGTFGRDYLQRMVNGFQVTRSILNAAGLKQAQDMPHWWDSSTYSGISCDPNNNLISPQFVNKTASGCLIRVLDQIDLMDYWDQLSRIMCQANNEIIGSVTAPCSPVIPVTESSSTIMNFNGVRTAISIAQEVGDMGVGNMGQTYYDELRDLAGNHCVGYTGRKCMEKIEQSIQHNYNSSVGFSGVGLERTSLYDAANPSNSMYNFPLPGNIAGITIHDYDDDIAAGINNNYP